MAVFTTIRVVRKAIRLLYAIIKLQKQLERDMKKARAGKLKPKNVQQTAVKLARTVHEMEQSANMVKQSTNQAMGPELTTLLKLGTKGYKMYRGRKSRRI